MVDTARARWLVAHEDWHLVDLFRPQRSQPGVATSLKTVSAIRAEIDLLKVERTRWRDFAARGVFTAESFVAVEKPILGRIAALERALAAVEPPESPRTAA